MSDYYDLIFDFFQAIYPLPKKSFEKIYNISEFKKIERGTKLVNQGQITYKSSLLIKGVARAYIIKRNGNELTRTIYTPLDVLASYTSMLLKKPSEYIYEAISDCHIQQMNFNNFRELCDKDPEVLKFHSVFLESLFIKNENMFFEISTLDAKARYLKLRQRIPGVDNLMPQYQIASYLNISPVQLSRIRAKL